jgi:hypothetical protein
MPVKVIHRIFENGKSDFKAELDAHGILHKYEESMVGKTILLVISEDDRHWPILKSLMTQHGVEPSNTHIEFTKAEIESAAWLMLESTGHFGYPQPESDFGYRQVTYDPQTGCERCGVDRVQIAPFRFKSEPKASRSQFLQLNWVFDEFFVRPEVRAVFEQQRITGVAYDHPIIHRSGRIIESLHQLRVKTVLPPGHVGDLTRSLVCCAESEGQTNFSRRPDGGPQRYCGTRRFLWPTRTPLRFRSEIFGDAPDIVKSFEWFGSGLAADRAVIISQRVGRIIREQKWRGVTLSPIELIA